MKKYLTAGFVAIALAVAIPAANAANTTGAGCGLGKEVLNGKAGFGWNLLAWLLNGIGGNQTFGMTSGTSGCDVTKTVRNETDRTEYAAINFDNLSADAARGAGEHLAGLAQVMTIAETDRASFYTLMQSRYDNLFSQTATPESMLVSLDDAMRADAHLAQYVR
jgi:hypothetical protein